MKDILIAEAYVRADGVPRVVVRDEKGRHWIAKRGVPGLYTSRDTIIWESKNTEMSPALKYIHKIIKSNKEKSK